MGALCGELRERVPLVGTLKVPTDRFENGFQTLVNCKGQTIFL